MQLYLFVRQRLDLYRFNKLTRRMHLHTTVRRRELEIITCSLCRATVVDVHSTYQRSILPKKKRVYLPPAVVLTVSLSSRPQAVITASIALYRFIPLGLSFL